MEKKQKTELILLNKLRQKDEEYLNIISEVIKFCSEMKQHIVSYHSKHNKEYIKCLNGDKYLDTLFQYKDKTFFIRMWIFAMKNEKVPLYMIYGNEKGKSFTNVEISNHSMSKEFDSKMYETALQLIYSKLYIDYAETFSNSDEVNDLNKKMKEIPKPSYVIENMACNKDLRELFEKYNNEQFDAFLKIFIFNYNEALTHIEVDYFGENIEERFN